MQSHLRSDGRREEGPVEVRARRQDLYFCSTGCKSTFNELPTGTPHLKAPNRLRESTNTPRASAFRLLKHKDDSSKKALDYSKFYGSVAPNVPVRSLDDFSIWYTPGSPPSRRSPQIDPELSFEYTGHRTPSLWFLTEAGSWV